MAFLLLPTNTLFDFFANGFNKMFSSLYHGRVGPLMITV